MKAMLFAAGLGTRLHPITHNKPKALVEVNGMSLLERNIKYLQSYNINEIVINLHYFADMIQSFLNANHNFGAKIFFSDETKALLETGGGLSKAQDHFKEDFIVMNVDVLTNLNLNQLIQKHIENKPLATLAIRDRDSSRKLFFNDNNELSGWKNFTTGEEIFGTKKQQKAFAFSGVQVVNPKIFDKIPKKGKFSITKNYLELMDEEIILGFEHTNDLWVDVGRIESLREAETKF